MQSSSYDNTKPFVNQVRSSPRFKQQEFNLGVKAEAPTNREYEVQQRRLRSSPKRQTGATPTSGGGIIYGTNDTAYNRGAMTQPHNRDSDLKNNSTMLENSYSNGDNMSMSRQQYDYQNANSFDT